MNGRIPLTRRRLIFGRPLVLVGALAVATLLALAILIFVPGPFGISEEERYAPVELR